MVTHEQVLQVPFAGDVAVVCRRCGEQDLARLGPWLDRTLKGDFFFRRGHLRNILRDPKCESWAVEADGDLVGWLMLYHGQRLHNLYVSPAWRGRGLGSALIELFHPTTIRAKTNMLAADPVPFYERLGYRSVAADPKRPWIIEMVAGEEVLKMDVRHDAPGTQISGPGGLLGLTPQNVAAIAGGQATSPPLPSPAKKAVPSIGRMTGAQVTAIAAKLRALSDDELAAVAHQAALLGHWKKRQAAARDRRAERERTAAAAAAGQHLDATLTGEARARVATARAAAAVEDLFAGGELNGAPQ